MSIKKYQPYIAKHLVFETTSEDSYRLSMVKGKNTRPEIAVRKELWRLGYRYRINVSKLPGKPDIVIQKFKLAIFIDGGFWHGYNWEETKNRIKTNKEYWIPKIEKNIERDRLTNSILENKGFTIIRIWESEIKKNFEQVIKKIIIVIEEKQIGKNE